VSDLSDRVVVYELAAIASTPGEARRGFARSALMTHASAPLWGALLVADALCSDLPCVPRAGDRELFDALVKPAVARALP
jgi:hypothetical protein